MHCSLCDVSLFVSVYGGMSLPSGFAAMFVLSIARQGVGMSCCVRIIMPVCHRGVFPGIA